jgi:hypothetical protein
LAGRVEVGTTKALLAQWERKEKSRLQEKPAVVEKPVVVEKPSQPRSYIAEKLFGERPGSRESPASGVGVKTLGLDINSFVPVCSFELLVWCFCQSPHVCLLD